MAFDLLYQSMDTATQRQKNTPLVDDLRLDVLLHAMAGEDQRTEEACGRVLLSPLTDVRSIAARREVRKEVAAHPQLFQTLLTCARKAMDGAARYAEFQKPRYDRVISNQKKLLTEVTIARVNLKALSRMHAAVAAENAVFCGGAVTELMKMIRDRFSPEHITQMEELLNRLDSLKQSDNLMLSASIGNGLRPAKVVLNSLDEPVKGRRRRMTEAGIAIPLSSVGLIRNAEDIVQSAVYPLLDTVAAFNKSTLAFCQKLSFQLGFYLGCVRLQKQLRAIGVPLCEPQIEESGGIESTALRNVGLALQERSMPNGNTADFSGKRLILITGVNQGGKTTFLRSVGQAQLMAQCGMFVAAEAYRCPLYQGIHTHFPSGEDTACGMGLLDVELHKMSGIVDGIRPHSLLLLNETFQTTMPLDAKYLAENTVQAFIDSGITVIFVTHLYAYAASEYEKLPAGTLFLRAERGSAAHNAFVLREGKPFVSAAGDDLYREVLSMGKR